MGLFVMLKSLFERDQAQSGVLELAKLAMQRPGFQAMLWAGFGGLAPVPIHPTQPKVWDPSTGRFVNWFVNRYGGLLR